MGAKLLAPVEGGWPSATNWGPFGPPFGSRRVPIRYPQNFMKIVLDLAEILRISKLDLCGRGGKKKEKGRSEGILLGNGLMKKVGQRILTKKT